MRDFSLAHLTVLSLPPPQMIEVAARTGYRHVGLRLIAVTAETPGYPLMTDAAMMRETKRRITETGVTVLGVEFIKITPEFDASAYESMLAAGAEIGARNVIAAPYDPDLSRLAANFGALADVAGRHGLTTVMEFFPWTVVSNLGGAHDIIRRAGRANTGILIDTLHFDRSGSALTEIDAIAPALLPFVHVCDAPAEKPTTLEAQLHTARAERLPPGDGGIGIRAILRHMPNTIPIELEVPMDTLTRERGPEEVARRAIEGARRVVAGMAAG